MGHSILEPIGGQGLQRKAALVHDYMLSIKRESERPLRQLISNTTNYIDCHGAGLKGETYRK